MKKLTLLEKIMTGFSSFGFDLTTTIYDGEHQDYKQIGNLRILVEFNEVFPRSNIAAVNAKFEITLSFHKSRQILKDYWSYEYLRNTDSLREWSYYQNLYFKSFCLGRVLIKCLKIH